MRTPRTLLALLLLLCVFLVARPASAARVAVFIDPQWPLGGTTPEATWDVLREALEARGHTLTGPFLGSWIAAVEAARKQRVEVVGAEVLLCVSEPAGGHVRVELLDAAGQPRLVRWGMTFTEAGPAERLMDVLAAVDPDHLPSAGVPVVEGRPPSVGTTRRGETSIDRWSSRRGFLEILANLGYVRPIASELPILDVLAFRSGLMLHSAQVSGMFQVGFQGPLHDADPTEVNPSSLLLEASVLHFLAGDRQGPYLGGGLDLRVPTAEAIDNPTIGAHVAAGAVFSTMVVRPQVEVRLSQDLTTQDYDTDRVEPDHFGHQGWFNEQGDGRAFRTTALQTMVGVAF